MIADLFSKERLLRQKGYRFIAGVDEVGRGPLAGPVVAAACILPGSADFIGVTDSKKLSEKKREAYFEHLSNHPRVHWACSFIEANIIDQINILQATFLAMQTAVAQLKQTPDYILIDGNRLPPSLEAIPAEAVIRGDSSSLSIAAASILAKVTRDRWMQHQAKTYPGYGFEKHKGYGTKLHLQAIQEKGIISLHRRTFLRTFLAKNPSFC